MADDTFDWDEVLVTRYPRQKEVQVSFVAVDGEGSPGGAPGSDNPCPPGTFKHYNDSLFTNGGFGVVTQPNTRLTDANYPAGIDADFFIYVSREEARPFDEYVDVSFEPRPDSGFPWTVDKLPDPVKVLIPKGQVNGKLEVKMPEGSKWSENPELYPDDEVGLYYLFDMVITSPACDARPLILNSPCTEADYVLPVVETQGRRPFLLLIDICGDEFPEGGGGNPGGTVPIEGDNDECLPHDCNALLTSSTSGSVAYFIRPNTEPVIQFANGSTDVLANFQGGPSNWTVGDQEVNPIPVQDAVAVDGRSSKPCAINLSAPKPRIFCGDALEANSDFGIYDVPAGDPKPTERGYGEYGASCSLWAYIDCTGPNSATCKFDVLGGIYISVATLDINTGNVSRAADLSALAGKIEVDVAGGVLRIYGNGDPLNIPANVVVFEASITPESATGWYGITVSGGLTTEVLPSNTNFDRIVSAWNVSIATPVGGSSATQITDRSANQTTPFIYRDTFAATGYNKISIVNRGGDPAIYGISKGRPSADFGRHLVDYTPPTYCERIP